MTAAAWFPSEVTCAPAWPPYPSWPPFPLVARLDTSASRLQYGRHLYRKGALCEGRGALENARMRGRSICTKNYNAHESRTVVLYFGGGTS